MLDIGEITSQLVQDERGVWISKNHSKISYPDEGNALVFPAEDKLFWFRHRNRCITALVRAVPPRGVLFDIGGGNGVVSKALHEAGVSTVLVEPGEVGVKNALQRGIPHIIWSTLEDANFSPASMAAVGMFDVLEHMEDDRDMLEQMRRLLLPEGKIYLSVPAYRFLWSHEDEYAKHFRRYSLRGVNSLLAAAGFKVDFATYIFSWLPPLTLLTRTLPFRLHVDRWLTVDREKAVQMDLGAINRIVEFLLQWEVAAIRRGVRIPVGGSCLVAASRA